MGGVSALIREASWSSLVFCQVRTQLSMNKGAGRRIRINVLMVVYFYFHITIKGVILNWTIQNLEFLK